MASKWGIIQGGLQSVFECLVPLSNTLPTKYQRIWCPFTTRSFTSQRYRKNLRQHWVGLQSWYETEHLLLKKLVQLMAVKGCPCKAAEQPSVLQEQYMFFVHQTVCDHQGNFTYMYMGWAGSFNDVPQPTWVYSTILHGTLSFQRGDTHAYNNLLITP